WNRSHYWGSYTYLPGRTRNSERYTNLSNRFERNTYWKNKNFILINTQMAYIEFDKEQLVNINFSKKREILRCSRTGSFATTTILGLNTRKYHGLFIVPQDNIDGERHLLVSNLNETFIINDMEFHIGVQQ